jgi:hypothetical protein
MAGEPGARRRVGLALLALVMTMLAPGTARAAQQNRVHVEPNQTVTVAYPPIPGQNPTTGATNAGFDPDTCDTAPTCDTIPLEVAVPAGVTKVDDFRLKVELDFKVTQSTQSVNGQKIESTELDLYAWDDPAGSQPISQSAGPIEPQFVTIDHPVKGKYQLTVNSSNGTNDGYAVKIQSIYSKGSPPQELTDTSSGAAAIDTSGESTFAPPAQPFLLPAPSTASSSPTGAIPSAGVPLVAAPDRDLTGISGTDAGVLAGNGARQSILKKAAESRPATSPSTPIVLVTMVFLPIAFAGTIGGLVMRRRPVAAARPGRSR